MTVTTVAGADGPAGPDRPEHEHRGPVLDAQASAALSVLLRDHPSVAGELEEAVRAHTHLLEVRQRAARAASAATEASRRVASLAAKLDPSGHRVLGFTAGAILVTVVILLDAVPLNWAAEAFGLDAMASLLVTGILLLASVAAMAAIEMTRHGQRRHIVLAVLLLAFLALVILRTEFLTTVAAEAWPAAVLQSVLLSAISAGLVLCGSAIIARTRHLSLTRARVAARQARDAAAAAQQAERRASDMMERHMGALRQILIPWTLGSPAPDGAGQASWVAALDRAVRALFPGL
jgi:hypothetical protein